jgi:hypothetical protein
MPYSFVIDPEHRLVISAAWGILRGEELVAHARALKAEPGFEPSFAQVADLRGITEVLVGSAGLLSLARHNPFGAGSRRAVIVATDVVFGMARMYGLMSDDTPDELRVFREEAEALEWLGITALSAQVRESLSALRAGPPA